MSFEYTVYGDVKFELSYSEEELRAIIMGYIESKQDEGSFTYLKLCRFLIDKASQDGHLQGAKQGVYYESPQLKPAQYTRVSRILWSFILSGKVFVDFYSNEYVSHSPNDTSFGIIQDNKK